MTLISVVITTHKREPSIVERAVRSVLAQTYENIELFVVDDSPSDYPYREEVRKTVEKYADKNVKYIEHEQCMGACAARNTGLEHCSGEFIAFLDDDDEWKPLKLEKQLRGFIEEKIALVYCAWEVKDDTTGVSIYPEFRCMSGKIYTELIKENFVGSTSYPLLRRSALEEIGGFDIVMQSAQDFDVWLRLAQRYEVNYVNEPLAVYHIHAGERITTNNLKKINGLERLNEKNKEYLLQNKAARHIRQMKLVPLYAGNHQIKKALKIWFRAMFLQPLKVKMNLSYLFRLCRMVISE